MTLLDSLLAQGRLSRMGYLLRRLEQAEREADAIIAATPEAQLQRLAIAAEEIQQRPRHVQGRHRHYLDD